MGVVLFTAQLVYMPCIGRTALLASERCGIRSRLVPGVVSCLAGWPFTRIQIPAYPDDYIFMEPFLGGILWSDECSTFWAGLLDLECAFVHSANLWIRWW